MRPQPTPRQRRSRALSNLPRSERLNRQRNQRPVRLLSSHHRQQQAVRSHIFRRGGGGRRDVHGGVCDRHHRRRGIRGGGSRADPPRYGLVRPNSRLFAVQYAGHSIQFDGHIAAIDNHEDYETRYDIFIGTRNCDESDGGGPNLQFRDVNVVSALGLNGPGIPDTLSVPDSRRVTADVEEFEDKTCLLLLDPVST